MQTQENWIAKQLVLLGMQDSEIVVSEEVVDGVVECVIDGKRHYARDYTRSIVNRADIVCEVLRQIEQRQARVLAHELFIAEREEERKVLLEGLLDDAIAKL